MHRSLLLFAPFVLWACNDAASPTHGGWLPVQDPPPTGADSTSREKTAPCHVVFYNVENLFDTKDDPGTGDDEFTVDGDMRWSKVRYNKKLHQLAAAIAMAGEETPVMIGLCEVENRRVVEDLARTPPLDKGDFEVVHRDSPDERGIDVTVRLSFLEV